MTGRSRRARSDFVEQHASTLVELGMARMPSRVLGALLVDDDAEGTAAELAQELQASPAAISGAVGYLVQIGLIVRHRKPGERRDTYRLQDDVWYESMYGKEQDAAPRLARIYRAGAEAVGPQTPAGERLADSAEFFEFLEEEMLGMMKRWRERKGLS